MFRHPVVTHLTHRRKNEGPPGLRQLRRRSLDVLGPSRNELGTCSFHRSRFFRGVTQPAWPSRLQVSTKKGLLGIACHAVSVQVFNMFFFNVLQRALAKRIGPDFVNKEVLPPCVFGIHPPGSRGWPLLVASTGLTRLRSVFSHEEDRRIVYVTSAHCICYIGNTEDLLQRTK